MVLYSVFFQNRSLLYVHIRCTQIEIHHQPQPDWCICSSSLCRGCSAPQSFKSHLGFSGRWDFFLRAQWSIDPAIQSTGQSCLNELFINHQRKLGEMAVRLQSQMETVQNKWGKVVYGPKGNNSEWTYDGEEQLRSWLQFMPEFSELAAERMLPCQIYGSRSRSQAWKLSLFIVNTAILHAASTPVKAAARGRAGAHKSSWSTARKHPHDVLAAQAPSPPASFLVQPVA